MKIKLLLLLSCITLFSFPASSQSNDVSLTQTYQGTIPCANCAGIEYSLNLTKVFPAADGTFELTMRYLGEKGVKSKAQYCGKYYVLRGSKEDINSTVYELRNEKLEQNIYLLVSETDLKLLDSEQGEIRSELNHTLVFQGAKVNNLKK